MSESQTHHPHSHAAAAPEPEKALDIREKGGAKNGQPQFLDRRLFMQLTAFTGAGDAKILAQALADAHLEGVVYEDACDPRGAAVLSFSENADDLLAKYRPLFNRAPFAALTVKPEYSMLGRTYAIGYEPSLEDTLLARPRRVVLDPAWRWAVWYPLRRTGAFSQLSHQEQGQILKEHGTIGRQFGDADLAKDIRLNCTGLDKNDNDFVIGLIGKDLHPLSALVQTMRPTQQTSKYIRNMGPFFVGKAIWQSPAPKAAA